MGHYLAVYTGTPESRSASGWDELDPDEREARQAKGVQAWNDWMTKHHDRLVLPGGPLGRTKGVSSEGVDDAKNNLVGFVVIEAQSHDEAAALFADHPHFSILPGEGVEVMECLSVPGTD